MNLFEGYANLDDGVDSYTSFDGGSEYMINCYLVPAFLSTDARFNKESSMYLQWNKDVVELNLYDTLYDFGIKGDITVIDSSNSVSYILEQFVSYELVVNITQKITPDGPPLKYEPYIFSIVNVEPISTPGKAIKKLKVYFEDLLTATAKRTSVGTFLKFYPEFKSTKSFVEAFNIIIQYLKTIIERNNQDKHTYEKETKFTKTVTPNENSIIEVIVDSMEQDSSLFELLQALSNDSCIAITPNEAITGNFEMIGDILIPMFCREEYPDASSYYYSAYGEELKELDNMDKMSGYVYLHRPFSFRNFYMPFEQCFISENKVIFESFSISNDENELKQNTMNGVNISPIDALEAVTANMEATSKRWKNIAFVSSGANGGSNRLVFFNWFYEYFNQAFLASTMNNEGTIVSNVLPAFYLAELSNSELRDDKDLAEKNSNVILIRNEKSDPLPEILMQIGKSIASLVLLNNSYSFISQGSLLRRPNEIVNLYTPNETNEESPSPIRTDLNFSKNIFLYVTSVIHSFRGNVFQDKLICNRIYEKPIY